MARLRYSFFIPGRARLRSRFICGDILLIKPVEKSTGFFGGVIPDCDPEPSNSKFNILKQGKVLEK
ncbi:MAG TPA: hypothetical protein VD735_05265 [Candidatus Saccharimonadales bacterium]|nr:hypothetical protein [Candidatus Saccharimonadales bacterium]